VIEIQLPPFYFESLFDTSLLFDARFSGVKLIRAGLVRPKLTTNGLGLCTLSRDTIPFKTPMLTVKKISLFILLIWYRMLLVAIMAADGASPFCSIYRSGVDGEYT
jgi:hypothetical protein